MRYAGTVRFKVYAGKELFPDSEMESDDDLGKSTLVT
jgi:hypothetical protein